MYSLPISPLKSELCSVCVELVCSFLLWVLEEKCAVITICVVL